RSELNITLEDMKDGESLLLVDDQLPILHVITKGGQTAHPHALLFGGRDLVANSFANHFPLELGKRQEDVQGESAHACGCIELLGYRDEGDAPSIKGVHDLGEVEL